MPSLTVLPCQRLRAFSNYHATRFTCESPAGLIRLGKYSVHVSSIHLNQNLVNLIFLWFMRYLSLLIITQCNLLVNHPQVLFVRGNIRATFRHTEIWRTWNPTKATGMETEEAPRLITRRRRFESNSRYQFLRVKCHRYVNILRGHFLFSRLY